MDHALIYWLLVHLAFTRSARKLLLMTTLMVIDGDRDETRSEAVARRLRSELAQRRISVSEVARRIGMTQGALSRRMTGHVEFGIDLIGQICDETGISFMYVTTGLKKAPPTGPDGPTGGDECARRDSNPKPSDP
ncbi:helix-turn-helix transcriptional regulator [Gordonia sp. (in: high G+C Gram-positive bacteria)]|uniref:helix-turn-helix domain-containing protein n=2 Tax=Gordonia sp. (in: high G+C Gram-positive bacteria) TaxID=84139 RepID=UPI00262B8CFB|nr:helix-turn-helix transcriptional regulator [Gordonia sp. (in: high G+C Gram-positive bacteria)]HMS75644.1 helix-turn-helix transcriptional regulator [Gordonia sp. (in: high G+C Gram-positive bacteria)]